LLTAPGATVVPAEDEDEAGADADAVDADTPQGAGLPEALSKPLTCGTTTTARPATTTTASTAINAGYARLCRSSWLRYSRVARR
jgi:hypothetical protein